MKEKKFWDAIPKIRRELQFLKFSELVGRYWKPDLSYEPSIVQTQWGPKVKLRLIFRDGSVGMSLIFPTDFFKIVDRLTEKENYWFSYEKNLNNRYELTWREF